MATCRYPRSEKLKRAFVSAVPVAGTNIGAAAKCGDGFVLHLAKQLDKTGNAKITREF